MIKKNYIGLHIKYRYYGPILMKLGFSRKFFDNTQTSYFIKIRRVGAELFHVDRQTDRQTDGQTDEANSRFSQFCERA